MQFGVRSCNWKVETVLHSVITATSTVLPFYFLSLAEGKPFIVPFFAYFAFLINHTDTSL